MAEQENTTQVQSAEDMAQEAALTALSETLAQLEDTPDNVPLIRRCLGHMRTLGLDAEFLETTQKLSGLIMLDEGEPCVSKDGRGIFLCVPSFELIKKVNGRNTLTSSSKPISR